MDLNILDIQKLKAFFFALKESNYHPSRISSSIVMNGERTPIDKPRCLELLRSFSGLEGKNDDQIFQALSDPKKIKNILGQLPQSSERAEFEQILEEKPVATKAAGEQVSGQEGTAAGQAPPAGESAGTMSGGGMPFPGMAGGAAATAPRRVIRVIEQAKPPGTSETVPGLKTTPETGLDYEGKPYEADAEHVAQSEKAAARSSQATKETSGVKTEGRRFQTPRISKSLTSAGKTLGSNASIGIKKGLTGVGNGLKTIGRGLGGAVGDMAGRGIRIAGRTGMAGLDSIAMSRLGARSSLAGSGASKKLALLFLGSFFAAALGIALFGGSTGTASTIGGATGGGSGTGGGGDISSCLFTRGDQSPAAASFKSQTLLGYFQEASNLTGIPAAVLAAFTRVESPSSVNKTDADLTILSNPAIPSRDGGCPRSPTGALGIMQIQPAGSVRGHDAAAVTNGARLLGIDYSALTEADYCDVRKSIIMGAGFLLKKMSYTYPDLHHPGYGDGSHWDPAWTNDKNAMYAMNFGYYGCLLYPSCTSGPNNYGDDVYNSVQACHPATPTPGGPSGTAIASDCPIQGGVISTTSYKAGPPSSGHCSPTNYEFACLAACPYSGRRAKAIDVWIPGQSSVQVRLPTLQGQNVTWRYTQPLCGGRGFSYPNCGTDSNGGSGALYMFETHLPGSSDTWYIQFVHMVVGISLLVGGDYPPGTIVGQTIENHVHTTIGKNIGSPYGSGNSATDCDAGWQASDFMCQ